MSRQKTVLIQTVPRDLHAAVVAHQLLERGHNVFAMFFHAFPERDRVSVNLDSSEMSTDCQFQGSRLRGAPDAVWRRRLGAIKAPGIVDREDSRFVIDESAALLKSLSHLYSDSFFVNDPEASALADLKPYQLKLASKIGFKLPRTLISNDPGNIRDFIRKRAGKCIFKPVMGGVWDSGQRQRATYTADVSLDLLPPDEILACCPGIFQEKVDKAFEVRAQFFGKYYGAIRIESSKLTAGDLDWRIDQNSIEACDSILLPKMVEAQCQELMSRLGIVAGGFDFIVTPEGEWVFLEVNEAGQFLFMEEWCEELRLLDAFCSFIEHGAPDFSYANAGRCVGFAAERKKPGIDRIWKDLFSQSDA